jgi:hypothetical protein
MTTISYIAQHSFECIGNRLCFSLHVRPIADFYVQKYEEAKGLKGMTPEVHDTMLQSIAKGRTVVAVQWDSLYFVRLRKKHCTGATISRNRSSTSKNRR